LTSLVAETAADIAAGFRNRQCSPLGLALLDFPEEFTPP